MDDEAQGIKLKNNNYCCFQVFYASTSGTYATLSHIRLPNQPMIFRRLCNRTQNNTHSPKCICLCLNEREIHFSLWLILTGVTKIYTIYPEIRANAPQYPCGKNRNSSRKQWHLMRHFCQHWMFESHKHLYFTIKHNSIRLHGGKMCQMKLRVHIHSRMKIRT